jgi:hypothetical protein
MDLIGMRQDLIKLNCGPPCPNDTEGRNVCDENMCAMLRAVQVYIRVKNVFAKCRAPRKKALTKFKGKIFHSSPSSSFSWKI